MLRNAERRWSCTSNPRYFKRVPHCLAMLPVLADGHVTCGAVHLPLLRTDAELVPAHAEILYRLAISRVNTNASGPLP
jgi:hypothetical protein